MKFYGREDELKLLKKITAQSNVSGHMTVITGRRRVGKTSLSIEATKEDTVLYLFISKKSETLLCEDFKALIIERFDYPIIVAITFQHYLRLFRLRGLANFENRRGNSLIP